MKAPPLRVLVVAAEPADARFASRVLQDHGDEVRIGRDVPDALGQLSSERFDVALVSLSLPRGDGLALVHHLRALHPGVDVIVMAGPQEVEETAHALALGVIAHVMRPLTGDALLVAADRARERRMLIAERERLAAEGARSRQRTATYSRCASFVAETDAMSVARRVLDACVGEVPCRAAALYKPQTPGSARLPRAASTGEASSLPAQMHAGDIAELDPTRVLHHLGDRVRVLLLGDAEVEAVVELLPEEPGALTEEVEEGLVVVAALGTAAFSAARQVEAIARTGVKDPDTSAYTFAYFGDVAGREIDRAARHGRRFALLVLSFDGMAELRERLEPDALTQLHRSVVDALLDGVRDSDVLARVEDDEFYLLLPETGLLGALACRRRIRRRVAAVPEIAELGDETLLDPVVGIAVYPVDGGDLGRLLRVGRRRAERSRRGVWRRLGLGGKPFWEAVEALLGGEDDAGVARDGTIALHPDLVAAHDEDSLARHAALPDGLVRRLGVTLVQDAARRNVSGTMYVAGDDAVASAVTRSMEGASAPLRAWVLGRGETGGARHRLPVEDPRLEHRVLLLSLTELGGYVLAARPVAPGTLLAYHAADLDVADGLVSALQDTYHLQPEVSS